jgi:isopentenyl diphosphate isomerase/L-lactate dehydrogenase-like FMN-dependent dehydrogenase
MYLGGVGGQRPEIPLRSDWLEARAREVLSDEAYGYVAGSAGLERTAQANVAAFDHWRILPRMLRDVSERDLSTKILNTTMPAPVLLAPVGVQEIVHEDGEEATARAAASLNVPIVLSGASTRTIEQVATASEANPRWFQLYWPNDEKLAASFLHRAEDAGYEAIVVTLDTRLLAWRPRDLQNAYLPFLTGQGNAIYFSDPVFQEGLEKSPEEDLQSAVMKWVSVFSDPSTTWKSLEFLRKTTSLPILLKGVNDPQDAREASEAGIDGVIVSNHGGRQVDGAVAALDALPGVVEAVGDEMTVLFDSGIRGGADGFKALALGARAVLLGRPYVWGLAVGGEEGVRQVVRSFLAELDLTFALSGCRTVAEAEGSRLVPRPRPAPPTT